MRINSDLKQIKIKVGVRKIQLEWEWWITCSDNVGKLELCKNERREREFGNRVSSKASSVIAQNQRLSFKGYKSNRKRISIFNGTKVSPESGHVTD